MPDPTPGARADIDADLFGYRSLLDDDERALLDRLREWLRSELAPVADEHWAARRVPAPAAARASPS